MAKAKSKAKTTAVAKSQTRRADMLKVGGVRDYRCYLVVGGKGQGKSTVSRDDIDAYFQLFRPQYEGDCHPRCFVHDYSKSRAFSDLMTVEEYVARLEDEVGTIWVNHPRGIKDRKTKKVIRVKLSEFPEEILQLKHPKTGKMIWDGSVVPALRSTTTDPKTIKRLHNLVFENMTNSLIIWDECTVYYEARPPGWQREILINHRNKGLEVIYMFHKLMTVPLFFSSSDLLHSIRLFKTGEKTLKYKQLERYACQDDLWEAYKRVRKAPEKNTFAQYYETVIV